MKDVSIKRFWAIDSNWYVLYSAPYKPYVYTVPIIGWALVQYTGGEQSIQGVIANNAKIDLADDVDIPQAKNLMYFSKTDYSEKDLDVLLGNAVEFGQKREQQIQEKARTGESSSTVGSGRLLRTGTNALNQRALQPLPEDSEGGGEGERPDTPQGGPPEVEGDL